MPNLNKVELLGQLETEPEIRQTPDGNTCCFAIQVTQEVLNFRNEPVLETCHVEVETIPALSELVRQFFHKGDMLFLDGRLKFISWTDRDSGRRRNMLKVLAENILSPASEDPATADAPSMQ